MIIEIESEDFFFLFFKHIKKFEPSKRALSEDEDEDEED